MWAKDSYDTVWRDGLWKMKKYSVDEEFIGWCKALYEDGRMKPASVIVENKQSRRFRVDEGLREGCPLSPLLYYSIYATDMVED